MAKHQTNAINTSATNKRVRESTDRELTKEKLEFVGGGFSLYFAEVKYSYQSGSDAPSAAPPAKHWFNGG